MKIIFFANGLIGDKPGLTGGEIRFIEIAKNWARRGYEIHLVSSEAGKRLCSNFNLEVILHDFPCTKKAGKLTIIFRALKSIFFLPRTLNDFDNSIIYNTSNMAFDVLPALRLKLKKRKKVKWVSLVHMLPPFPPWKRKKSNLFDAFLYFINEIGSLWIANLFADILLAVSQATARRLRNMGINMKKVYPVECGVSFMEIKTIARSVSNKIYDAVSVKRLQGVKGVFDLIEIWEIVLKAKPDAKLLLVGEGIDEEKARSVVKEKGLDKNIHFTGVIYDFEEKITKIAQSKLFLTPSYEENWSIVIGEAMAVGTPVIAYSLVELVDVWRDNFIHVSVGDKMSFSKKVISLLNNPDSASEFSRKANKYVEKYDWQDIADRELKIILGEKLEDFKRNN